MNTMRLIDNFRKAYESALECKWKGGDTSITGHLIRRKKRGHFSENATEADLIQRGLDVLKSSDSNVYEYISSRTIYFVVYKEWAVFFDENGLWDTVFPPDLPERYFAISKGYRLLGKIGELIK